MGEHTPGPWSLEPHGLFRSNISGLGEGEDFPLAYISAGEGIKMPIFALHEVIGDRSAESLMADARLIAVAPELLEALEGVLEIAKCWEILDGGKNIDLSASQAVIDARAAIAKARGEQA